MQCGYWIGSEIKAAKAAFGREPCSMEGGPTGPEWLTLAACRGPWWRSLKQMKADGS
jgi:hypothetical protein